MGGFFLSHKEVMKVLRPGCAVAKNRFLFIVK